MSTAETPPPGFEVVVAEDGSIPADSLARFGIRPGAHLRLLPESEAPLPSRKSLKGALVGKIDVEAFEDGMEWGEADRITQVNTEDNAGQ